MRLTLSSEHPRNSTYSTEAGEVLYKVDKPLKLSSDVATIRKAVRTVNGVWHGDSEQWKANGQSPFHGWGNPSGSGVPVFEGHFAVYAQVEFHTFESTRFRFNGHDVKTSDYFRKQGLSWFGRDRVFKASDGKEYRWQLRAGKLEMITNDEKKAQVVKFKEFKQGLGSFLKGRPASLEIDPSCGSILDEIIMTFIYCHKLRKDRERSANGAASSAGGAS